MRERCKGSNRKLKKKKKRWGKEEVKKKGDEE